MRCKCCDAVMTDSEMVVHNPISGEYEDLCYRCRSAATRVVDSSGEAEMEEIIKDLVGEKWREE